MAAILRDLRLALRSLIRTPGFTLVAVLSLGLGIGTVATIYTWTDRFILNPLPVVKNADRLVYLQTRAPGRGAMAVAYRSGRDWAERSRTLDAITLFTLEQVGIRQDGGVERAFAALASENFFDVLGVRAIHGRTFQPGEEAARAPVAVLGYSYWERRFGADPAVVGRRFIVNGQSFEIVGVLPPRFGGSYVGLNLDLYLPVTWYPMITGQDPLDNRGWRFLQAFGRLRPGATWDQVGPDLERIGADLERAFPGIHDEPVASRVQDQGPPATMKPIFIALLGVSGLVLLIACANVANLLLARAGGRAREIGLMLAIGASRARVVRQLLAESAILAALGGSLGLLVAQWGSGSIMLAVPPVPYPVAADFPVNWRITALAAALAAVAVILVGLWPALKASRPDLVPALRGLATGDRSRTRARSWLVAGQMALAVVSLASAGLFLRVIERSRRIDAGFADPGSLLLIDTELRIGGYTDSTGPAVIDRLLDRVRALPGVRQASVATFVPLGWSCCSSAGVEVDGYTPRADEDTSIPYSLVGPDYFQTMGIARVAGRGFTAADRSGGADVAVVNEAFVRRYWTGKDPLGRQLTQHGRRYTVVGVARDGKYRELVEAPFPLVYEPIRQEYRSAFTLHIRFAGARERLIETTRKAFASINPDLPLLDPRTMTEQMGQSLVGQRIGSRTLAVFGALALLLATVGIYGVTSYLVGQRTREIGVRVALGASGRDIGRMIVREGLMVTGWGAAVGLLLSVAAGHAMRGLLLGVHPADPTVYALVVGVLGLVAMLALLLPARRAVRVDPIEALKAD